MGGVRQASIGTELIDGGILDELVVSLGTTGAPVPSRATVISSKPGGFLVASLDLASTHRPRRVAVKLDTRHVSIHREYAAYQFVAAYGLPVAQIAAHGDVPAPEDMLDAHGERVDSIAFLATKWLEGHPIAASDPTTTHREVGGLLRTIHDIPATDWADQGCPPGYDRPADLAPIAKWIRGWLNVALDWWEGTDEPDAGDVLAARNWFDRIEPQLAAQERLPALFDGRPDHFIVGDDGALLGMIDLETVGLGDPVMDLAVIGVNDPGLLTGVLNGWNVHEDWTPEFDDRLYFYMFLRALAAAEYNTRVVEGNPALVPVMLDRARRLLRDRL